MDAEIGVILFGHGSRLSSANDHLRALADRLRRGGRFPICEAAFLELAAPSMIDAVKACVARGARRVVVVPYFLAVGRHVVEDIPDLVEASREALGPAGGSVSIEVTDIIGNHPAILEVIGALVEQAPGRDAASAAGGPGPRGA